MKGSMDNERIEDMLAEEVRNATPDMLEDLMKELGLSENPAPMLRDALSDEGTAEQAFTPVTARKQARSRSRILAGAAALLMVIGGLGVFSKVMTPTETFAVVGLDVNPGIEISIDDKERVISAEAVNDEGAEILADMDLKGVDVDVAGNAVIGAMLTGGYLTDTSNSVLVSVRAKDEVRGREIEKELADKLNTYLGGSDVNAAILGQYYDADDELMSFAHTNGISAGKAWLIRSLLAQQGTKMTEDSLLKLSTQELILLAQNKSVQSDTSVGKADTSKYIGEEKAFDAALRQAGVSRAEAADIRAEFDCDDGRIVYEVEFTANGNEYEYDVDAETGKIVKSEVEKITGRNGGADPDDDDDDDDGDDDDDDWDDDDDD